MLECVCATPAALPQYLAEQVKSHMRCGKPPNYEAVAFRWSILNGQGRMCRRTDLGVSESQRLRQYDTQRQSKFGQLPKIT